VVKSSPGSIKSSGDKLSVTFIHISDIMAKRNEEAGAFLIFKGIFHKILVICS
jgi:hypothetical protein